MHARDRGFDSSEGPPMGTTMNITKTGTAAAPAKARRLEDAWPQAMPRGLFAAAMLGRRLSYVAHDQFPGTASPDKLARLGEPVLVRTDRDGDEVEALLALNGDSLVLVDAGYGHVCVEVAGVTRSAVEESAQIARRALESAAPEPDRVSVAFWMQGNCGGDVRLREIE